MRVTVSLSDSVGEAAERVAKEEGMSVSALFAEAVERYLRERQRDRAIERIEALIGNVDLAKDATQQLAVDRKASDR